MLLSTPNDHIVVNIAEKHYLIDTGSPISFNYDGIKSLKAADKTLVFWHEPLCDKNELDALTGISISGIIGMDIIKQTGLAIDLENKLIDFSSSPDSFNIDDYVRLSFSLFMGQYIVTNDIFLGSQLKNVIIDTGAYISYISAKLESLFEGTGEAYEDFSPEFGALKGEDMFGLFDAVLGVKALTDKGIIFIVNDISFYLKWRC